MTEPSRALAIDTELLATAIIAGLILNAAWKEPSALPEDTQVAERARKLYRAVYRQVMQEGE